jgi:hypothetical protein
MRQRTSIAVVVAKPNVDGRRTLRRLGLLALVVFLGALAAGSAIAWAGHTWLEFVELEVEAADAAARFAAARENRAALVTNWLALAGDSRPRERPGTVDHIAEIAEIAERAEQRVLPLPVWRHPLEVEAAGEIERELSAALDGARRLPPDDPGEEDALADLDGRIARAEQQLDLTLDRLAESLDRYERARRSFPASIVAGLAGRDPRDRPVARSRG